MKVNDFMEIISSESIFNKGKYIVGKDFFSGEYYLFGERIILYQINSIENIFLVVKKMVIFVL